MTLGAKTKVIYDPDNTVSSDEQTTDYSHGIDGNLTKLTWPSASSPQVQAQYIYTKNGLRKEGKLGDTGSDCYMAGGGWDAVGGAISHACGPGRASWYPPGFTMSQVSLPFSKIFLLDSRPTQA